MSDILKFVHNIFITKGIIIGKVYQGESYTNGTEGRGSKGLKSKVNRRRKREQKQSYLDYAEWQGGKDDKVGLKRKTGLDPSSAHHP